MLISVLHVYTVWRWTVSQTLEVHTASIFRVVACEHLGISVADDLMMHYMVLKKFGTFITFTVHYPYCNPLGTRPTLPPYIHSISPTLQSQIKTCTSETSTMLLKFHIV
jgi:hypothetical protein